MLALVNREAKTKAISDEQSKTQSEISNTWTTWQFNRRKMNLSMFTAGGLDDMTFKGPFQPRLLYDSMIDSLIKHVRSYLYLASL